VRAADDEELHRGIEQQFFKEHYGH
jgi:hypothetical protein